jgi:hypothetical protein
MANADTLKAAAAVVKHPAVRGVDGTSRCRRDSNRILSAALRESINRATGIRSIDSWPPPRTKTLPEENSAMKRLRTSQPDLFKTSTYELPSTQRRAAVEILKMLLVEVMMMPVAASNTSDNGDNRELGNDQDHR